MLRVVSLNLNGIRSAFIKGFDLWLKDTQADIVCLQETKAQPSDLSGEILSPNGYQGLFHSAEKKGYSGVAIYTKLQPDQIIHGLGIPEIDTEGRYLRIDIDKLTVVSLYLPSGSSSPERQAAKFDFMARFESTLEALRNSGQHVIICGDWNIAHREIDLKNWKSNQKNSGFLPEERAWLDRLINEQGWVDTYRALYPNEGEACYTWWSNRGQAWAKNVGWRLDYQLSTPAMGALARSAYVYKDMRFSDHAPLVIDYDYPLA